MKIDPNIVKQFAALFAQMQATNLAPTATAVAQGWEAAVRGEFPAIVGNNGKRGSMNITKNPMFAASTTEVRDAANSEIKAGKAGVACAEACYRADKRGVAVTEYLAAPAPKPPKAAPAPKAAAPVAPAALPQDVLAALAAAGFTVVPTTEAKVAAPVKRVPRALRLRLMQTAVAAGQKGDRAAVKTELVQAGLLEESSKMRLDKMVALAEAEIAKISAGAVASKPHAGVPNLTAD